MNCVPLTVTLRLATPLAMSDYPWHRHLCLDALLSGLLVARGRDPSSLPLEVVDGLPTASQMFVMLAEVHNAGAYSSMRRNLAAARVFNQDETLLAPQRGKEGYVKPGNSAGQLKAATTAYPLIPEHACLCWFAHGDVAAVRRLMAWVVDAQGTPGYGIGRAANAGFGEAEDVRVAPLRADWTDASLAYRGQPARPIPIARWLAMGRSLDGVTQAPVAWHYPYYATAPEMCVVPSEQVLPGSLKAAFAQSNTGGALRAVA
ncbi:MAG TPA: hypothetical protein VF292_03845 [Rhodanobacteraceae bacterium]